jgi:predicted amidohydrolase YtcJ
MFEDAQLSFGSNQAACEHSGKPHQHEHEQAACACCSPVFATMQSVMTVTDLQLRDADHWRSRGRDLPGVATHTQVFINAKILTMDDGGNEADAMAIKDGKIVAVGSKATIVSQVDDTAQVIDCQGKLLLPGFIEPHFHFLPVATLGQFEDVGPFRYPTVEGALGRLRQLADAAGPDDWIMGRQFDPSLQEGADTLTRDMLDSVSTTQPIYVYNASLHFAYCNSKAFEVAGIHRNSPDDATSAYGRDANGELNGVLQGGKVMNSVIRHNLAQRDHDLASACLDVCAKANALGITTFCDQATGMSRGVSEVDLYRALADSGKMTARLRYSPSYMLQARFDESGLQCGDGDEMVRAVGWKIVSDGSNQGFSGLQREPYLHSEHKGVAYVEAQALTDLVEERLRRGWAVVIHANGDQAIDNTLDAYESAWNKGLMTNTPCRIEHCSILHDEQIDRIAKMNLSPSFLIGHVYYWGQAMRDKVFGEIKATLLDRTKACEDKGIRWTLHSDEPVTEMGPLRCIENAVTRKMWKEPLTILAADECISVDVALRAMTRDAAWQCHSDHEVGSLEVGKFADFVILDEDPRSVNPDHISQIKVLETWMGGRQVYTAA